MRMNGVLTSVVTHLFTDAVETRLFTLMHFQIWCYVRKCVGLVYALRSMGIVPF